MTNTTRTLNLLRAWRFTSNLQFILPVIVPFWHSQGINQAQIGWLQTIFMVTMLAFQLPTGRLADKYGRRRLIIAGSILVSLGFACYALAHGFWAIAFAEFVLGIGFSCRSGADLALLRQSLEDSGEIEHEKHYIGQLNGLSSAGEVISAVIGGWVASIAFGWPLWLSVIGISLAIPMAFRLPKDEHRATTTHQQQSLRQVLAQLVRTPRMLALSCFTVSAGVATHLFVWLFQPYLTAGGLELKWFGIAWALYNLSYALFSWRIRAIESRLGERWSMVAILLAPVIAYFGLGLSMSLWLIPLAALFMLSRALNVPITTHLVHEHTDAAHYATTLSGLAAIQGMVYAVMGPISGWVVDSYGLQTNLLLLGTIFGLTSLISYRLLRRHHLTTTP